MYATFEKSKETPSYTRIHSSSQRGFAGIQRPVLSGNSAKAIIQRKIQPSVSRATGIQVTQLMMPAEPGEIAAVDQDPGAPDVGSYCTRIQNAAIRVGRGFATIVDNFLPNPATIYNNWNPIPGDNAANDERATNLTWEADKIAWLRNLFAVGTGVSLFFAGRTLVSENLPILNPPENEIDSTGNPSSEGSNNGTAATVATVLGSISASLFFLESKIRHRIAFISPTDSDRNAARRMQVQMQEPLQQV